MARPRHGEHVAGNLTLVGSIANLIVVEGAKRRGVTVTFGEYARFGVPLTLATLAVGNLVAVVKRAGPEDPP